MKVLTSPVWISPSTEAWRRSDPGPVPGARSSDALMSAPSATCIEDVRTRPVTAVLSTVSFRRRLAAVYTQSPCAAGGVRVLGGLRSAAWPLRPGGCRDLASADDHVASH